MRRRPASRVAEAEQQLDRLHRLDRADDPGQDTEHPGLRAVGRELGRRWLGKQAAIARARVRNEHRSLALEPEDRSMDDGYPQMQRGIVDQVAGRKVVGAVDDQVIVPKQFEDVRTPGVGCDEPRPRRQD